MSQWAGESQGVQFCALLQCHPGSTGVPFSSWRVVPLARTGCSVWVLILSPARPFSPAENQSRRGLSPLPCPLPDASQMAGNWRCTSLEDCSRRLSGDGFPFLALGSARGFSLAVGLSPRGQAQVSSAPTAPRVLCLLWKPPSGPPAWCRAGCIGCPQVGRRGRLSSGQSFPV